MSRRPTALREKAGQLVFARLVRAGVDVLLDPDDPEAVVNGLVQAVESGT